MSKRARLEDAAALALAALAVALVFLGVHLTKRIDGSVLAGGPIASFRHNGADLADVFLDLIESKGASRRGA